MANPNGNEASLRDTRYKAAWKSGPTRTIRVPVVLAEATLEYAHRLDDGVESHDTMNKASSEGETSTSQFIDTSDSTVTTKLPDAATLLNRLGEKRKEEKTKTKREKPLPSLSDIQAILDMLES